jgi:hypothetical protein
MDVERTAAAVARRNDGLLTWSQLREAGLSRAQAVRVTRGLRALHDGVYVTGHGRVTREQRWRAAVLSTPATVLSHASTGACWGFRPVRNPFETVTRPGSGGPRRIGRLRVHRSEGLEGHCTRRNGIALTTPARTLLDLAPLLTDRQAAKAVRETIRLKLVTALALRLVVAEHPGRRGTVRLRTLAARFDRLPIERTRSDAEARALEVLDAAGIEPPLVNEEIAGEEADLVWPNRHRILEIDGPQWHLDRVEDARKESVWRAHGWMVERISSDPIFDAPERLLALVHRPP